MTNTNSTFNSTTLPFKLRSRWGWFFGFGIALLAFGLAAFSHLILATIASVFYVGMLMIAGGLAQIIQSFQVKNWGSFLFWFISGIVYAAAGFFTFQNPILAIATLTLFLSFSLIVSGIFRMVSAIGSRSNAGWGWIFVSGLVTLIVGCMFFTQWPWNSFWLLGMVLAFDLTFQGISAIALGMSLKSQD